MDISGGGCKILFCEGLSILKVYWSGENGNSLIHKNSRVYLEIFEEGRRSIRQQG